LWRAWSATYPNVDPGEKSLPFWLPFDLARLSDVITAITGYADAPPLEWDAATGWYAGQIVTYHGHLWRAATRPTSGAGHEPGVDPAWVPHDLISASAPPTGLWKSWTGTQSAYDALAVKDPATLYVITP
jgi:hypothetical protein